MKRDDSSYAVTIINHEKENLSKSSHNLHWSGDCENCQSQGVQTHEIWQNRNSEKPL